MSFSFYLDNASKRGELDHQKLTGSTKGLPVFNVGQAIKGFTFLLTYESNALVVTSNTAAWNCECALTKRARSFIKPQQELSPYIESFWVCESATGIPLVDRNLAAPNGCSKLIIPYENSLFGACE